MPEQLTYYILPLKTSLSFRYIDVQRFIEDRLKKTPYSEKTEVEFELCDTYAGGSGTLDLNAHFVWRSPEVEILKVNFKAQGSPDLSMEIMCDFLSYHPDVEDIMLDSRILHENQESIIQQEGYYFWKFWVWENEIQNSYTDMMISALLDLSDGIVFSCKRNWEVVLSPRFDFKSGY